MTTGQTPHAVLPSPIDQHGQRDRARYSDFYEKAKKYVEGGGFLYASVAADAAIPDMETSSARRLVDTLVASEVYS